MKTTQNLRRGRLTGLINLQPNVNEERIYESRIVIQLNAGKAIYCDQLQRLYFFDSPDKPISVTISSVFSGMGYKAKIESVLIDQHGFIAVGKRIALDQDILVPVITALRLIGVSVKRGPSEILKRARY